MGAVPAPQAFTMAEKMFKQLWERKQANYGVEKVSLERELQAKHKQVSVLVDRIVKTDNENVMSTYENKLNSLEKEKRVLQEKIQACGKRLPCFDEHFRTALDFLQNPYNLWASKRLEDKQTVLNWCLMSRWLITVLRAFEPLILPCLSGLYRLFSGPIVIWRRKRD